MKNLRRVAQLLVLVVLGLAMAARAQASDQPPTVQQIVEGLDAIETLFLRDTNFRISYRRTSSRSVTPSSQSGGLLLAEWSFARLGSNWLIDKRFLDPGVRNGVKTPRRPWMIVVKGAHFLEWQPDAAYATVEPFGDGENCLQGLYYTLLLSLDVPKYLVSSAGADLKKVRKRHPDDADQPWLPEFLRTNSAHYRVLEKPEIVAGRKCWIVEWPGMDRIAVDPERGMAIISRSYCWGPSRPLRLAVHNGDHREVVPGLWLPFAQTEYRYADVRVEKELVWGQVTAQSEYHLLSAKFGDVAASEFDVTLPGKTQVQDAVRNMRYMTPSNEVSDPLSDALTAAIQDSRKRAAWLRWIAIIGGVLIFALLLSVRKYSRKNKTTLIGGN